MFGISGEHLLILGIILLIFGPRRLPELGNTLGKAIKNFKDAISGIEEAKFRKLEDDQPTSNPSHQQASQSTKANQSEPSPNSTSAAAGSAGTTAQTGNSPSSSKENNPQAPPSDTSSSSSDPGNKA